MRYAITSKNRTIINIIECEPSNAACFDAHYLGNALLGIGDTYPAKDIPLQSEPTETQILGQQITDEQLERIEMGQAYTDLELAILGG